MRFVENIQDIRNEIEQYRKQGLSVGLVPTMGYLHEGHASLIQRAKQDNARVVVSIFVNPIQFGPNEDFDRYPRDLQRDLQIAQEYGADLVFHPTVQEMYPKPIQTTVSVSQVSERLCGASRPGHFAGVATVVLKLLNIVTPDRLYMGLKDYQQIAVVKQFVADLNVPVEVVPCPIVREPDGLAKSSRNIYLDEQDRQAALVLSRSLSALEDLVAKGERNVRKLKMTLQSLIEEEKRARIDYVEILDSQTLQMVKTRSPQVVAAVAVYFGKTRLIDNTVLNSDGREFYAENPDEV